MAKDNEASAISSETIDTLDGQVKKGKPRKFFLMFKGTTINTLVVFKKGAFQAKILQAKKDGFKGDVCCGIVTGSGKNLIFQLPGNSEVATAMAIDNWTENPEIKPSKLREFLSESGLEFKPEFSIVTNVANLQNPESDDEDAPPDQAGAAATAAEAATPNQGAAEADDSGLTTKLAEALKRLRPLMDKVIESNPSRKGELLATFTQVAGEIKSQQLEQAKQKITDFAILLKSLISNAKASEDIGKNQEQSDDKNGLLKRLKELSPRISDALSGPNAARVQELVGQVKTLVKDANFSSASQVLDELEALLGKPISDSISLVALGKARLEWNAARQHAISELRRLKEILREVYEGDAEEEAALNNSFQRLDSMIEQMTEELGDSLDDVLNADLAQRPALAKLAKAILSRFTNFVESDEIMSVIDDNEYAPDMIVAQPLRDKLSDISTALA